MFQISEKLQNTSSMQNWRNFAKSRNTKNVIYVLSSVYYNENCQFQADFSTIAYVFVFSCDKKLFQKIADQSDPYPLKVSLPWHAFPVTGRCEAHGTT